MKIYVGNLSYNVKEDELKEVFGEFGEVASVTVITDKFSGQSKGFGFVEMPTQAEAEEAIKSLNGRNVKGRDLKVNEAKPREEGARRPGGGGGGGRPPRDGRDGGGGNSRRPGGGGGGGRDGGGRSRDDRSSRRGPRY